MAAKEMRILIGKTGTLTGHARKYLDLVNHDHGACRVKNFARPKVSMFGSYGLGYERDYNVKAGLCGYATLNHAHTLSFEGCSYSVLPMFPDVRTE